MRPCIAFVTATNLNRYGMAGSLTSDDAVAVQALERAGMDVKAVAWDDPRQSWSNYRVIILRSCWDYHLRLKEFLNWLKDAERLDANIWNPPPRIRWNLDKNYLLDLESMGIRIVPSVLIGRGSSCDLKELLSEREWTEFVIKPTVGLGSYRTIRGGLQDIDSAQAFLNDLSADGDAVVQKYLPEVCRDGEWSLVFFGGRFSHAVIKRPVPGDFRVQHHFGGTVERATPEPELIAIGYQVLESLGEWFLYARVDGVLTREGFRLIELELIEPRLYFKQANGSPELLIQAIQEISRQSA